MRDNGMACGFNTAILDNTGTFESLWKPTRAFIDMNPDIVSTNSQVITPLETFWEWLVNTTPVTPGHQQLDDLEELSQDEDDVSKDAQVDNTIMIFEGGLSRSMTDVQQVHPDIGSENSSDILGLERGRGCRIEPTFEIGSLEFFRSPQHIAYFNHLDSTGVFYYDQLGDLPMHTLSATMFLPRQSVFLFKNHKFIELDCGQQGYYRNHKYCLPSPSPAFEIEDQPQSHYVADEFDKNWDYIPDSKPQRCCNIQRSSSPAEQHARWEQIWKGLAASQKAPQLQSGHTVIDERNFALSKV
jgi:hypothetical protein